MIIRGLSLSVLDYPDIWLHIDAAWLGAAFSCPEHRERCRVPAINKYADSLDINFHKVGIVLLLRAFAIAEARCTVGIGQFGVFGLVG